MSNSIKADCSFRTCAATFWADSTAAIGQADFTVNPPAYSGTGTLEKVALGQLAEAMHDNWITGSGNVRISSPTTQGWSKAELLANADASLQVEARDGSLPHLTLAGESESAAR